MIQLLIACCFWTVGIPIPANERGPILRKPDVVLISPPAITFRPSTLDLACLAAIRDLGTRPALASLASLVALGHAKGGDCAVAVDFTVEMHATNAISPFDTHAYWRLAGEAATTRERRIAAFRMAALYAWHEAFLFVRSALRGGAFPLEPWIAAGDAFARAADDDPRLAPYAIDAYENALRASRQRELTPAHAAHIARALAALPGDRAAALRLRIHAPD
jgi:hypothetical protein